MAIFYFLCPNINFNITMINVCVQLEKDNYIHKSEALKPEERTNEQ